MQLGRKHICKTKINSSSCFEESKKKVQKKVQAQAKLILEGTCQIFSPPWKQIENDLHCKNQKRPKESKLKI